MKSSRALPLALLLLLWGGTLWHLDRYPPVHEDEPWILSPAYKLATEGVYGSDLLAGFYHIEERYFEFLPLMSLLQAAAVRLFGVSVVAMRFLPAALGVLTLALVFACARRAHGAPIGVLAMLLLLGWQWAASGDAPYASGIPLADLSRIARYDLLVAPLGMGALWCWMRARRGSTSTRGGTAHWDAAAGALAGLAGLAHLYGLFFLVALAVAQWLTASLDHLRPADRRDHPARAGLGGQVARIFDRGTAGAWLWMTAGAALVWLPWLAAIAFHLDDYLGQNYHYADRFALADPAFYLSNLLAEPRRYRAGFAAGESWLRPGFWLLWLGAPLSLLALARQAWRQRAPADLALCAAAASLPLLFALLIAQKTYNYVAPLAPLFAWLVAWALARRWARRSRWTRISVAALLALVLIEGAGGWMRLHTAAETLEQPAAFHAALREAIPRGARVLGTPRFWLALTDHDYRSHVLPFMFSSPRVNRAAIPLERALEQINPRVVIVDTKLDALLADRSSAEARERGDAFMAYLQRRGARLVAELREPASTRPANSSGRSSQHGAPVRVYVLEAR